MKNFQPCLEMLDLSVNRDAYVTFLINHPFFLISQKSHEMFHSGMFAWMIKEYPVFAGAFFPDSYIEWNKGGFVVEIEQENRDITLSFGEDECYVIENKFKGFHTQAQLLKYQKAMMMEFKDPDEVEQPYCRMRQGTVLGLVESSDRQLPAQWEYVSYYQLLPKLVRICNNLVETGICVGFKKDLIAEYLKFLDALLSALSSCRSDLGNAKWMPQELQKGDGTGFSALYRSMIAHAFCEFILLNSDNALSTQTYDVTIDCPYDYGDGPYVHVEVKTYEREKHSQLNFVIEIRGRYYKRKDCSQNRIGNGMKFSGVTNVSNYSLGRIRKMLLTDIEKIGKIVVDDREKRGVVLAKKMKVTYRR